MTKHHGTFINPQSNVALITVFVKILSLLPGPSLLNVGQYISCKVFLLKGDSESHAVLGRLRIFGAVKRHLQHFSIDNSTGSRVEKTKEVKIDLISNFWFSEKFLFSCPQISSYSTKFLGSSFGASEWIRRLNYTWGVFTRTLLCGYGGDPDKLQGQTKQERLERPFAETPERFGDITFNVWFNALVFFTKLQYCTLSWIICCIFRHFDIHVLMYNNDHNL